MAVILRHRRRVSGPSLQLAHLSTDCAALVSGLTGAAGERVSSLHLLLQLVLVTAVKVAICRVYYMVIVVLNCVSYFKKMHSSLCYLVVFTSSPAPSPTQ